MEINLEKFIRSLIELDSTAVELKGQRDAELSQMEEQISNELKSFEAVLEDAVIASKQKHSEIIEAAKLQAASMDEAVNSKISELQTYFASIKENAAKDIWEQLLNKSQK